MWPAIAWECNGVLIAWHVSDLFWSFQIILEEVCQMISRMYEHVHCWVNRWLIRCGAEVIISYLHNHCSHLLVNERSVSWAREQFLSWQSSSACWQWLHLFHMFMQVDDLPFSISVDQGEPSTCGQRRGSFDWQGHRERTSRAVAHWTNCWGFSAYLLLAGEISQPQISRMTSETSALVCWKVVGLVVHVGGGD